MTQPSPALLYAQGYTTLRREMREIARQVNSRMTRDSDIESIATAIINEWTPEMIEEAAQMLAEDFTRQFRSPSTIAQRSRLPVAPLALTAASHDVPKDEPAHTSNGSTQEIVPVKPARTANVSHRRDAVRTYADELRTAIVYVDGTRILLSELTVDQARRRAQQSFSAAAKMNFHGTKFNALADAMIDQHVPTLGQLQNETITSIFAQQELRELG